MVRPLIVILAAGLAVVAAAISLSPGDPGKAAEPSSSSRTILFTYHGAYQQPPKDRQVFDMWIPLPANDGYQKITDLTIQVPVSGETSIDPENGNTIYHLRTGPRGGVPLQVFVRFKMERREVRSAGLDGKPSVPKDRPKNLDRYLKGDRLVPIDEETKSLAAGITKGKATNLQKARAIYDYVVSTLKYDKSGVGWGRGDLRYAVNVKKGNCADLGAAFTGLARASGIPARQVMGFRIPTEGTEGDIREYHCWSEFYLEGFGWIPVDCAEAAREPSRQDAYFGRLDANRIQLSVGRDIVLAPPQNGDPISMWLYPYAEGDGQPLTGSSYRFSWKVPPATEQKPVSTEPGTPQRPPAEKIPPPS